MSEVIVSSMQGFAVFGLLWGTYLLAVRGRDSARVRRFDALTTHAWSAGDSVKRHGPR